MNKLALSGVALAIVGVAAAGIGGTACTVTSGVGDDGGLTYLDSGSDTSTTGNDSGTGSDTGTTGDSGSQQDGGSDSGACALAPSTGNATCDTCVQNSCDTEWCACAGDTNMVDDSGASPACLAYVTCVSDCIAGNPDAGVAPGTPQQCETDCSGGDAGGTYPQSSVSNGNALLNCVDTNCVAQCM